MRPFVFGRCIIFDVTYPCVFTCSLTMPGWKQKKTTCLCYTMKFKLFFSFSPLPLLFCVLSFPSFSRLLLSFVMFSLPPLSHFDPPLFNFFHLPSFPLFFLSLVFVLFTILPFVSVPSQSFLCLKKKFSLFFTILFLSLSLLFSPLSILVVVFLIALIMSQTCLGFYHTMRISTLNSAYSE